MLARVGDSVLLMIGIHNRLVAPMVASTRERSIPNLRTFPPPKSTPDLRADVNAEPPVRVSAQYGRSALACTLGVVAVTLSVCYPALEAGMVSDDFTLVGRLGFSEAARFFTDTFGFGRNEYRPITAMSYAVDKWLWSDAPHGYHLTNLLLHASTAVLLLANVHALTGNLALATLAAGIFVIHPVNHSRVAWISARDASVCAVFLLAALRMHLSAVRNRRKLYRVHALLLAAGSLLAYEGAVILPALFFAVEFLFVCSESLRARAIAAARVALPYLAITAVYVGLWQLTFAGELGAYDLARSPLGALENYGRLVYTLFYGHRRVAFAIAYTVVLAFGWRSLWTRYRSASGLGAAIVLISFAPYCVINGFAPRFGYLSALGFALILAACVVGSWRDLGKARWAVAACTVLLCGFYMVEMRKLLFEWTAAGRLAAAIQDKVRSHYPTLPEGAVLRFRNVPKMYRRAMVFPTGLEVAIQRLYDVPVLVRDYDAANAASQPGAYLLEYVGGEDVLRVASH
jgi:hypothetical protein